MLSIINSLNSSKAHGYDNISVKMIKICKESVTIPPKNHFWGIIGKRNIPRYMEKTKYYTST